MPSSRREFERNLYLLAEKAEKGQVRITKSSIRTAKGLSNARYAPNRRVNFNTIDEMARLMANSVTRMEFENEKDVE